MAPTPGYRTVPQSQLAKPAELDPFRGRCRRCCDFSKLVELCLTLCPVYCMVQSVVKTTYSVMSSCRWHLAASNGGPPSKKVSWIQFPGL